MTISNTTPPRVVFNCDGVTTVFPVNIQAYQPGDISVVLTAPASSGGAEVTLTLNSDYSLAATGTLNPPAQTLTTLGAIPYAHGYTLQAYINPPVNQQSQYVQGQAFPSLAVQTNLDRLTQMVQRVTDAVSRAIHFPDGDVAPSGLLPVAAARALMMMMFDANGNATIGVPNSQVITTALLAPFLGLSQTASEAARGVTPVNLQYAPGDLRRYGADPTGVVACDAAVTTACSCNAEVFDAYPGGGTYLFNTGATINGTYPLKIRGQVPWFNGNTGNVGTKFVLGAAAGANAATLKFTGGPLYAVEISGVGFTCQNSTLGQVFINPQTDVRGWVIERCTFMAPPNASNNTTAIQFQGAVTYSGATSIRDNFFDGVNVGIALVGPCTTIKITNNEFIGYSTGVQAGYGIEFGSLVQGAPQVTSNYFEGWTNGIFGTAGSSGLIQIGGIYAVCTVSFFWTGTTGVKNTSIGEQVISEAGVPVYNTSDLAGNTVFGGAGNFMAATPLTLTRAFIEGNGTVARSYAMGYPQTVAYVAGNFTANGAMTWTVASGGQATYEYAIVGKTLTVWFQITGTVGGTVNTQLQVAIPGGFVAAIGVQELCEIINAGTGAAGQCTVAANGAVISFFISTAASPGNWTAGSCSVIGRMTIPVA